MSTHPNTILMVTLTPDNLSRKTMREILNFNGTEEDYDNEIQIEDSEYFHCIMESDYDESYQISAQEGDLVFFDMITYGYGERIEWEKLETQKKKLEKWAKEMCEKFNCSYKIFVSANNW